MDWSRFPPSLFHFEGSMRMSLTPLLLAVGSFALAASAHSQSAQSAQSAGRPSLAEVARNEKARRAANARTGKSSQVAKVDEQALRNVYAPTFTAVEVTGAGERSSTPAAPTGGTAPSNPNRPPRSATKETGRTTPKPSTPTAANTELGKGWSTNHGVPNTGRGWDTKRSTKGVVPIHPTTPQGPDYKGPAIYR